MTLPDICTYAGIPSTIAADASVPQRNEWLQSLVEISRPAIMECILLLGIDQQLHEPLYAYIHTYITGLVSFEVCTYDAFKSELLDCITESWAMAQGHDVMRDMEELQVSRGTTLTPEETIQVRTECRQIAGIA